MWLVALLLVVGCPGCVLRAVQRENGVGAVTAPGGSGLRSRSTPSGPPVRTTPAAGDRLPVPIYRSRRPRSSRAPTERDAA